MSVQLDLMPAPEFLCVPLPRHVMGEGWNQKCGRCWMSTIELLDGVPTLVGCGCSPGCHECGALPGELGCEYCDAASGRDS